jgi:hypothetical protein
VYGSFASTVAFRLSIASSELSSSQRYDSINSPERARSVTACRLIVHDALRTRNAIAAY